MEQGQAIMIGKTRFSETSLIIHWLSPQAGMFRTLAKGALRPKSAMAHRLDLFVTMDLRWIRSRRSDLHTLTEVHWIEPRLQLRESYGRVLAATYLIKLIEKIAEPEAPIPAIYELLTKALDYLNHKDPIPALIERFEWRLAQDLGIAPEGPQFSTAHLLSEAIHQQLPVQRSQLWEWMKKHP